MFGLVSANLINIISQHMIPGSFCSFLTSLHFKTYQAVTTWERLSTKSPPFHLLNLCVLLEQHLLIKDLQQYPRLSELVTSKIAFNDACFLVFRLLCILHSQGTTVVSGTNSMLSVVPIVCRKSDGLSPPSLGYKALPHPSWSYVYTLCLLLDCLL